MRSAAIVCCAFALAALAHVAVPALAAGRPGAAPRVSDVRYDLDAGDAVAAVGFTVTPPATTVRARVRPDAPYVACSREGARWRCPLGRVPLTSVQALAVAAARA